MVSAVSTRKYLGTALQGEICWVRDTVVSDAEYMVGWRNESRHSFFDARPVTHEQTLDFLKNAEGYLFTVVDSKDGKPCGFFSAYNIDEERKMVELGRTMLDSRLRGRGIIQEAYRLVFMWLFTVARIERIHAVLRADNVCISRFNRKCGFETEGIQRQHFMTTDGLIDGILVGFLRKRYLKDFNWKECRYKTPNALADMLEEYLGLN